VIIEATPAEELLKYHQIFWAITSVLYADYQQEFLYILSNLLCRVCRVCRVCVVCVCFP
jgi:hypothetical protein